MPTIAVFTKNCTNPAYAAFRIAAEQLGRTNGVRIRRFVAKRPDTVDEQTACHAATPARFSLSRAKSLPAGSQPTPFAIRSPTCAPVL
jgi:hypothetical protein